MSDTKTEHVVTPRGPVDRFYINDHGDVVIRHKDQPEVVIDLGKFYTERFAAEGFIFLAQKHGVASVLDNKEEIWPDRSLPTGPSVQRSTSFLVQAIAEARLNRVLKAAGGKPDKEKATQEATVWAQSQTKEQRAKFRNHPEIIKIVARMRSEANKSNGSENLDDLMGNMSNGEEF